MTSKQRAQLRSLASNIDAIIQIGKEGIGENLYKNVEGNFDMKIFESGVKYFK